MEQPRGRTKETARRALLGVLLALGVVAAGPGGTFDFATARAGTDDVSATRAEVRQIQKQLNALGYEAGPVDGQYGQTTRQAILKFERAHDMPAVGLPDTEVRERIAETLHRKRADARGQSRAQDDGTAGREQASRASRDETGRNDGEAALSGTRWRLHHPQGQNIVLEFRQDGAIQAPAGSWRWERRDGRIVIHYDSGSRLTSRLVGQLRGPGHMSGWGQDTFGERWQWSADRLNDGNGS